MQGFYLLDFILIFILFSHLFFILFLAQSAGAVEYIDCISAEG